MYLEVKAKNLKVDESNIGKLYDEVDSPVFLWGPLHLKPEDINRVWGTSKTTSVILLYSGELILAKEYHRDLVKKLDDLEKLAREQGENPESQLEDLEDEDLEEEE